MVEIRPIHRDEIEAFRVAIRFGFGQDLAAEERGQPDDDLFLSMFPIETCLAGFDERGRIVATFGSFDFDLTVPGGSVPLAGTTVVTVHPTHRRQGILTRMMDLHLRQAVNRGKPMAGLWASEETIYGRFGYGHACPRLEINVPATVTVPAGADDISLRFVTTDEAATVLPPIYDQVRSATPGFLSRTPAWWYGRHLRDLERGRNGASSLRVAVARRLDRDVGYLTHRLRGGSSSDNSPGKVEIEELVAVDDDARRALWHFATHVDLYPDVTWWNCPVDEPVLHEVDRIRSVTAELGQSLWLRPLDVTAVMEARRYDDDGVVVLGVADTAGLAAGVHRLEVTGGEARCEPVTAEPDLELDVATLGALYLGGVSALGMARAGRITGRPEAVIQLDRLLRTTGRPHCIEVF